MNRLNQTEPKQFSFVVLGFLWGILFLSILLPHQRCLCRVEAVKSRPVHSIRDFIFPILKDQFCRVGLSLGILISLHFTYEVGSVYTFKVSEEIKSEKERISL
jgi:hypothetical protein